MNDEYVTGSFGIEGRYPFLDPEVVQEFLWLASAAKNSIYKRPIHDYLSKYQYPFLPNFKVGFDPKSETVHDGGEQLAGTHISDVESISHRLQRSPTAATSSTTIDLTALSLFQERLVAKLAELHRSKQPREWNRSSRLAKEHCSTPEVELPTR